jgi:hypothetical protein
VFKKTYLTVFLVFLIILVPEISYAEGLTRVDGKIWTQYVFGNGAVIADILTSIKLMMVPDVGSSGFNSLLMFLATLGFLVLAIQAGFDPSKNLMKMFSYIIVVSAVHIMTVQVSADIAIADPVSNYYTVVTKVPALVGVPPALISEIGFWLTKTIETNFVIPTELTISGGGAFNLFGRVLQATQNFKITKPELKQSLSAYIGDCAVPAMATGKISASELMDSTDMVATLSKASHNAIMTKYWPDGSNATLAGDGSMSYAVMGGLGAVVPCAVAWKGLEDDLENHASNMLKSTGEQWAKTGVMVPFEAGMSAALALASNGGANQFANYNKPQGYILQQAMVTSMNGSFRSAAAAIGNNDVIMAAAVSQAEQSQKTSWFTSAQVFNNMMGYVYTTLQAFIFAIAPIVIIALMVPGLGKSIFVNYAQILVWLMLWQPMLCIVNYLVTLFGKVDIGATLAASQGLSMANQWVVRESTNDLMLAAQFLGTSVPMLAWGLVKGSMAFTEFISHGIGSSMAQQAGASAATGNISMGGMSMDNTSMNKFNTAMSSTVGSMATVGSTGGTSMGSVEGGHTSSSYGQVFSKSAGTDFNEQTSAAAKSALTSTSNVGKLIDSAVVKMKGEDTAQSRSEMVSLTAQAVTEAGTALANAQNAGDTRGVSAAKTLVAQASAAHAYAVGLQGSGGAGFNGGKPGEEAPATTGPTPPAKPSTGKPKGPTTPRIGPTAAVVATGGTGYNTSAGATGSDGNGTTANLVTGRTAAITDSEANKVGTGDQRINSGGKNSSDSYQKQQRSGLSFSLAQAASTVREVSDLLSQSISRGIRISSGLRPDSHGSDGDQQSRSADAAVRAADYVQARPSLGIEEERAQAMANRSDLEAQRVAALRANGSNKVDDQLSKRSQPGAPVTAPQAFTLKPINHSSPLMAEFKRLEGLTNSQFSFVNGSVERQTNFLKDSSATSAMVNDLWRDIPPFDLGRLGAPASK